MGAMLGVLAETQTDYAQIGWSVLSVVAILAAIAFGFPFLGRGGGQLRRRGTLRYKVRFRGGGPGAGITLVAALVRNADAIVFAVVTVGTLTLIVLNARA